MLSPNNRRPPILLTWRSGQPRLRGWCSAECRTFARRTALLPTVPCCRCRCKCCGGFSVPVWIYCDAAAVLLLLLNLLLLRARLPRGRGAARSLALRQSCLGLGGAHVALVRVVVKAVEEVGVHLQSANMSLERQLHAEPGGSQMQQTAGPPREGHGRRRAFKRGCPLVQPAVAPTLGACSRRSFSWTWLAASRMSVASSSADARASSKGGKAGGAAAAVVGGSRELHQAAWGAGDVPDACRNSTSSCSAAAERPRRTEGVQLLGVQFLAGRGGHGLHGDLGAGPEIGGLALGPQAGGQCRARRKKASQARSFAIGVKLFASSSVITTKYPALKQLRGLCQAKPAPLSASLLWRTF